MKFSRYLKDKINFILFFIIYCMLIVGYTNAMQVNKNVIIIILVFSGLCFITGLVTNYLIKNKYIKEIENILDNLQEKYLLSEIIEKPRREENLAYYRIMKRTNKSMLENITNIRNAQKDYKEYIESWVHEIKIPITTSKLLCENNKSELTSKIEEQIEEINNFVEQALFYARLDYVSNDFMIRKINLEELIRSVLVRNKKVMIQNNMKAETKNLNVTAYTDEKWLEFIVNQIIINSIKYKKEKESEVVIRSRRKQRKCKIINYRQWYRNKKK